MTLSRLQAGKRVNLAIDALAEVVKSHPEAKLVIVGYGEERKKSGRTGMRARAGKACDFHGKNIP